MIKQIKSHPSFLVASTVAAALTLTGQVTVWATSACQVPNPNEVFCTALVEPQTCDGGTELACEIAWDKMDRNKFPDGPADSESGTTTEEEAKCYCEHDCVWDADAETCSSCDACCGENDPNWKPADKTVVGTDPCPTEEE